LKSHKKRKPARTKSSRRANGAVANVRVSFDALVSSVIKASASEFRADLLTSRTILERQRDLVDRLHRLCGTFPALLVAYAEKLSGLDSDAAWIRAKLRGAESEIKSQAKRWLPLACDGVEPGGEWMCPGWLQEYPISANSPNAHMPVELAAARLTGESTAKVSAKITSKIRKELTLAFANARVYAQNISSMPHEAMRSAEENTPARIAVAFPHSLHSDDYRSISYGGGWHKVTQRQAVVIKAIHDEHKRGIPEIDRKFVMRKIGISTSRMRDSFRGCRLWGSFVSPGSTKGTVRLDWPDSPRVES
jgi:hypothetical protein